MREISGLPRKHRTYSGPSTWGYLLPIPLPGARSRRVIGRGRPGDVGVVPCQAGPGGVRGPETLGPGPHRHRGRAASVELILLSANLGGRVRTGAHSRSSGRPHLDHVPKTPAARRDDELPTKPCRLPAGGNCPASPRPPRAHDHPHRRHWPGEAFARLEKPEPCSSCAPHARAPSRPCRARPVR